jgi:hypothetical protein
MADNYFCVNFCHKIAPQTGELHQNQSLTFREDGNVVNYILLFSVVNIVKKKQIFAEYE